MLTRHSTALTSQGIPSSLRNVEKVFLSMDWGEVAEFVEIGKIGADSLSDDVDYYIMYQPQNLPQGCVVEVMRDMVSGESNSVRFTVYTVGD